VNFYFAVLGAATQPHHQISKDMHQVNFPAQFPANKSIIYRCGIKENKHSLKPEKKLYYTAMTENNKSDLGSEPQLTGSSKLPQNINDCYQSIYHHPIRLASSQKLTER
jgi:hypothetical protein